MDAAHLGRAMLPMRVAGARLACGAGRGTDAIDGRSRDGRSVVPIQRHACVSRVSRSAVLVALVVMSALATLHYDECVPPRPTAPKPPPSIYLICAARLVPAGSGTSLARSPPEGNRLPGHPHADVRVRALARRVACFRSRSRSRWWRWWLSRTSAWGFRILLPGRRGIGAGDVIAITYEYGNTFIIAAGLLNMLVVLDVFDIAKGRK